MALLGDAIARAEQRAETRHPGDLVYHDQVVQQVKSQFATIANIQQGIQKQNYQTLIKALTPGAGTSGGMLAAGGTGNQQLPTTQEELFADPANRAAFDALDPIQQSGVLAHLQHNAVAALGHPMKEDPEVIADAANRIFLPSGNANKITNVGQIIPLLNHGVGIGGSGFLSGLIDKSQSVNGVKMATQANLAFQSARSTLLNSLYGQVDKAGATDAANQYYAWLQGQIDQYQSENKDPSILFRPTVNGKPNPDYVRDPAKIMSFLTQTPQQATKDRADAIKTGHGATGSFGNATLVATPGWDIGKTYTFKQGKFEYLGGDPVNASSFKAVK